MKRREFITLVGGATAAWPLVVRAQQPVLPVIGFLGASQRICQRLRELGWIEGRTIAIDFQRRIARAKAKGVVLGRRKKSEKIEQSIRELRAEGMGILKIGRTLGVGTSVVQRVVAA